ncbi:YqgE/AlgH family protein [Saccharicrinis sp. FJH62]|uniref:YqgE/AlgH family protein n=1 Tax=Saccharicrinis sp. FJH62 TaxID=3344657 RepID=UPI0035D49632
MKLDIDIFKIKQNNVKPKKGRVLISEPFLQGYYFSRSIVLLTEHDAEGSMGLVLNKPLDLKIGSVLKDVSFSETKLICGGPVSPDKLFYIHSFKNVPGAIELIKGLFFGGDFEYVKDLLAINPALLHDIRFFIGYAGWSPGQLADELKESSWLVTDLSAEHILHAPINKLWRSTVESLGEDYARWTNFPSNPEMN